MSQGQELTASTILLIEADTSLRRLIALGLQHRGMQVIEADSPAAIPIFQEDQPDLLVLDVDSGVHSDWSLLRAVRGKLAALPAVVLAWEGSIQSADGGSSVATVQDGWTCLTKPFDARALHKTIDQILNARAAQKAAQEASAEAALLATYSSQAAPSIWPVITAAGLLLAFIGMLLQAAILVIGLLIVGIALLCWTLGPKREPQNVAVT